MIVAARFSLRLLAALFAGLAIVVAAASWRLSDGPVSVGFLSPYIKESLTAGGADVDLKIGDTVLAWRGLERGLDIIVVDLDLLDNQGRTLLGVPEMAIGLDSDRLLAGDFVPATIDVTGAALSLRRDEFGRIDIGIEGSRGEGASVLTFLRELTLAPDQDRIGASLKRISMLDAAISFEDRRNGVTWDAPRADLIINRSANGLGGDLIIDLNVGGQLERFVVSAALDYVTRRAGVTVDFSDVLPPRLASKDGKLAPLAKLNLPTSGRISFSISESADISNIQFDLVGGKGDVDLAPVFDQPSKVDAVQAKGSIDPISRNVVFNQLVLTRGGASARLTGQVGATDRGPVLSIAGQIAGFGPSDIREYWPPRFAPPVRRWFDTHIEKGLISSGVVRLNVGPDQLQGGSLDADSAEARLVLSDVRATYFGQMPPITNGAGTLRLTGDDLDLVLTQGQLGELSLKEGNIKMVEVAPKSWEANLEFVASGDNNEALRIIDADPLRLASRFGIPPDRLQGVSATRVQLGFPVRPDIAIGDVRFAAATNIRDGALQQAFGQIDLSQAAMTLEITKAGLIGTGTVALNGVPVSVDWRETFQPVDRATTALTISGRFSDADRRALGLETGEYLVGDVAAIVDFRSAGRELLSGTVDLDMMPALVQIGLLNVTKLPGRSARAVFHVLPLEDGGLQVGDLSIQSDVLSARGVVELGPDRILRRIDLSHLAFGQSEIALSVRPRAPDGFIVAANGPRVDAGPFLESFFDQTGGKLPPLNFSITTPEMKLSDRRTLFDVVGEFNYVDKLESLRALGSINREAPIAVELITTPEGPRRLTISGDNAGVLARTTGLFDDAVGGDLLVSASLRETDQGPVIDGRMEIEGIRVRQATSLSRVLTLASLTGILETLDGEGLQFARADIPFRFHDGMLEVIDARAFGPSLGITLDGEINNVAEEISMFGTLIPAYTINSVLGEIPLIGTLLVGRQGEGVFALTYGISGPVDRPVISVNPLSALAPGFLRNFFAIFTGAEPDPRDPDRPFLEDQPG